VSVPFDLFTQKMIKISLKIATYAFTYITAFLFLHLLIFSSEKIEKLPYNPYQLCKVFNEMVEMF